MRSIWAKFFLVVVAIAAMALIVPLPPLAGQAFAAGLGLFTIYALLLILITSKMMRGIEVPTSRLKGGILILGLAVKVFGVGIGAYVSLVVWKLRPDFFVVGAVVGLCVFAGLIYAKNVMTNKTLAPY